MFLGMTNEAANSCKSPSFVVVKCSCGAEILLVPDVAAMGAAIENHVVEHQKKYGLSKEQADSIRDYLIIQTFEAAAVADS